MNPPEASQYHATMKANNKFSATRAPVGLHGWAVLWALLAMLWASAPAASAADETFGFDTVARQASALARLPYQPPAQADARLVAYSYDQYRSIRYRPERALWRGSDSLFQVQFFPLGRGFTRALALHEVVDGKALPLRVPAEAFDAGGGLPPGVPAPVPVDGAAGWRLSFPLNDAKVHDEVAVFLGASYFRAVGAGQAYGLSARALAVDTAGGNGEEFPAFTAFWLVRPAPGAREMTRLCAARQCTRGRCLSLRGASRHRYGDRCAGAAVPARGGGDPGPGAADQHVPQRREPAAGRRLPPRGARFGRPAGRQPPAASACGGRWATRRGPLSPRSPHRRRAASA